MQNAGERSSGMGLAASGANRYRHVSQTTATTIIHEPIEYLCGDDFDGAVCELRVE